MGTIQETKVRTDENDSQAAPSLTVADLQPLPEETWESMLRFSRPTPAEIESMRQTVDVLLQRGYELVVATYDHLRRIPETAEVLGWEQGVDEEHLAERRRFFTIWLARMISIDLGTDFARYLFQAGQFHAGHGPRQIHTPAQWVIGSMGLVLGAFADFIREAHDDVEIVAPALAGWNKYLMIQLNQMLAGYEVARQLQDGDQELTVHLYGKVRHQWGQDTITVHYRIGDPVVDVLRKILNYIPFLRGMMFKRGWQAEDDPHDLWRRVTPIYTLRGNWRVLLNGQDLQYYGGFERELQPGDTMSIFPPSR